MSKAERANWTICYRKRTANRFVRVSNWSGTWAQAYAMCQMFSQANPTLEVWYTSDAQAEADGFVCAEDRGNILAESGRRVRIVEGGEVPADMIARIPLAEVAHERWLDGEQIAEAEGVEPATQAPTPIAEVAAAAAAYAEDVEHACDCDGTHAPTPGGHSVACRQRETLDLFGEPTLDEQHEQAIAEYRARVAGDVGEYAGRHGFRPGARGRCSFPDCGAPLSAPQHVDNRGLRMGPGHVAPATVATAYDEALAEDAHREALAICASIPTDGRPAAVTELLTAAELLTDEHEHLAAVRRARAVDDEQRLDDRGLRMGPGNVAPATLAAAHAEAVAENADRDATAGRPIVITFERIGRLNYGPALRIEIARSALDGGGAYAIEEAVYRHAQVYIRSREFDVSVDLEQGKVLIDGGRFGRGHFTPLPVPAPEPVARSTDPRADRLAAAFDRFTALADSGGPGTAEGVIAAVEQATTVPAAEFDRALKWSIEPGTPAFVSDVRRMFERLGFKIS